MRGVRLEVLRKYMDASDKTRIQYASKFAGSSNYWKNSIGMNKAIIDNDVLGAKAEIEKKYAAFAQGKPEYEGVVEKIDAIIEKSTPRCASSTIPTKHCAVLSNSAVPTLLWIT